MENEKFRLVMATNITSLSAVVDTFNEILRKTGIAIALKPNENMTIEECINEFEDLHSCIVSLLNRTPYLMDLMSLENQDVEFSQIMHSISTDGQNVINSIRKEFLEK